MSVDDLLTSANFWTVAVILSILFYQWWKKPHPKFPPLIRGFPGLGVTPYLGTYPQKVFKKWSLEMNEPVIGVRIGTRDAVVLNTYEACNQILAKQSVKAAGKPTLFLYNQVAQSHGIALKDFDDSLRVMRGFFLRYLKKGFVSGDTGAKLEKISDENVDLLMKELKKTAGNPIDIKAYIGRHALNTIAMVVTNKHYEYDDPVLEQLFERISYLISESDDATKISHILMFPSLRYFPVYRRVNEKAKKYMELISDEFIQPLIDEHKANFDADEIADLIDEFLLAQQNDKEVYNDKELLNLVRDLFMAATDTTACSVGWAILCYLHFPEHKRKLYDEINEILGSDGFPNFDEHKNEMPFTFAFLYEAMRYRSAANQTFRKSTDTIVIGKYVIPKGTMIYVNILGVHKDPNAWPDPEKFDPYRHIDEDGDFVPANKTMPYGLGFRICPGEALARREIFVIFVKLLQTFHVKANLERLPSLEFGYNTFLHSPLPYEVTLEAR